MGLINKRMRNGFTLIETLVAILLLGLASSAFLLGITQAKLNLESIRIKDLAHQELKEYTENIKSQVASGVEGGYGGNSGGIQVTLVADPNTDNPLIQGNLHKKVIKCDNGACGESLENSGDYSIYYFIHTWITWPESKRLFGQKIEHSKDDFKKLEFKSYQVRFQL